MNLLFRADASVQIGTGHVMRCLALAQAWQDAGGRAVFAMAQTTPSIQTRLASEGCEELSISVDPGTSVDASEAIALAREHHCDWIVVDGYQFDADYQRALKAAGCKVLFVDDFGHATHYSADVVLNQNVSASAELYFSREPETQLLLGPRYCLLRREFSAWRDWKREVPPVGRQVLVMMGGSDPENLTARVIGALALVKVEGLEATVVVGGSNPHSDMLQACAAQSGLKITVRTNVSNVAEFMAAADVAVSAAGSTCWELCVTRLPALLIDVADNQTALATELDRRECAIHIGTKTASAEKIAKELTRLLASHELRQALAQRSRRLVDGNGAGRVVSALRGTPELPEARLQVRRARHEDSRLLWEWANDADVREASFSPASIPWETHVAWFAEKLGSGANHSQEKSVIFIAELMAEDELGMPVGQIRFEVLPDGSWEVDVSLVSAARGRGLGSALIRLGVQELINNRRSATVHAFVKPGNAASVKAFEDANFQRAGTEQTRGHVAIHLVYDGVQ
jgi:UDP-2,4-diacetamido-2,4,6-trideoxy-beta-L-altropyranose hydrolase